MSDLKKVKPGDKLRIPAATFNTFVDAAKDFQRRQRDQAGDAQGRPLPAGQVYVKNASGADANRFAVLAITGPVFEPTDTPGIEAFQRQVALACSTPAGADDRFIILAEPIAAGALGRAWAFGVCPVQVDVQSEGHAFARPDAGVVANLVSSDAGGAPILWKASGTGVVWALVRLDLAGGGAGVCWGKAISDWSSGNTVSMHPCDPDGGNEDAETTITGYLVSPTGGAPAAANVSAGDVLAYLPFGEDEGLIVNADLGGLPPGPWDAARRPRSGPPTLASPGRNSGASRRPNMPTLRLLEKS